MQPGTEGFILFYVLFPHLWLLLLVRHWQYIRPQFKSLFINMPKLYFLCFVVIFLVTLCLLTLSVFVDLVRIPGVFWTEVNFLKMRFKKETFYWQGQATDIQIQAEEIIKLKRQINGLYVKHTGLPLDKIGLWNITQYACAPIIASTEIRKLRILCWWDFS